MNVKMFSVLAVLVVAMAGLFGVCMVSEDSEAALGAYTGEGTDSSTASNPYSSVNCYANEIPDGIYVALGGGFVCSGSGISEFSYFVSVTSGFGLSITTDGMLVSGTLSKLGDLTLVLEIDTGGGIMAEESYVVHVVNAETDVDFTSPSAVSGISGGRISYTATTNIDATFSENGGTGASWLSVSSSGVVSGTFPTVTSKQTYTYTIKATSSTLSTNTATQTITIDVYPVAKISGFSTISGTEDEAITSTAYTSNLSATFSKSSGTIPSGLTLSSNGTISGTPTVSGTYTAVIRAVTTVGPTQTATKTITFNIDPAESTLAISVASPAASYKVGSSISIAVSSNVDGTTFSLSGTASSFLSISSGNIVGSVPSSYVTVQELTLSVTGTSPKGQTDSETITFKVEPVTAFTSVPTAQCIITPVYNYDADGNPSLASNFSLIADVDAASAAADFVYGDTLSIQGTFTGTDAESVAWYWGDGSSDTGFKATHTYDKAGVYEVRCVATNSVGTDEVTITVEVGSGAPDYLYYGVLALIGIVLLFLIFRVGSSTGRGRKL